MQKDLPSIEQVIRQTWHTTFGYPVRAFTVSRTDAHVHALDQWVKIMAKVPIHFTAENLIQLNLALPKDIQVLSFNNIPKGFNIIGAARLKEYCYLVTNKLPQNLPNCHEKILHFIEPLDLNLMNQAAECFLGIHNFTNFQRREKVTAQMQREIIYSKVSTIDHWDGINLDTSIYCYSVHAKGFLRQMVRIMMGAILNVGYGKIQISELKNALHTNIKAHAGFVTPGYGLYLKKVHF